MKYRLHRQKRLDAAAVPGLKEMLPALRAEGVGLDLALSDTAFNRDVSLADLENLRRYLHEEGIALTCHLPYRDLHLGSEDASVHDYARDCLLEGLEMAGVLKCRIAVLHAGFSNQIRPSRQAAWRERFLEGIQEILRNAEEEDIVLAIENTFEPDGEMLRSILESVNSPYLRACIDLGHTACYSRMAPEEWIEGFKDRIAMLHFHDNDGQDDLHLPCGQGVVGYDMVFDALKSADLSCPIALEVEEEAWEPSVEHLRQIGFEFGEVPDPVS
ncbi:MAG: sugar phosphate isomerase/epimerase family protein [Candidatus Eisenbacteria bacterium]|nr:sugar phosphate isomerase/epimerase family protein [Candidatus Eisenbacteria bacterium]